MKIGALVLAAGKASRFGGPKQLLEIDNVTLLDRACLTALAAGCDPVLRVVGAHAREIMARDCPARVWTFHHAGWEEGMGSSLASGLRHLLDLAPALDAVLVLLADQPAVSVDLLGQMFAVLREPVPSIVLCDHGDATGPPALFAAEHFDRLLALGGDQGAKGIASRHPEAVAEVPFPEGAWDIDSPEVWERFTRARAASSERRSR
jgi:CTP:molybdopterin cytidylyltransferase MocA